MEERVSRGGGGVLGRLALPTHAPRPDVGELLVEEGEELGEPVWVWVWVWVVVGWEGGGRLDDGCVRGMKGWMDMNVRTRMRLLPGGN